jgi:hypothetical protein
MLFHRVVRTVYRWAECGSRQQHQRHPKQQQQITVSIVVDPTDAQKVFFISMMTTTPMDCSWAVFALDGSSRLAASR